jgi:THUMP domain-containing protein
LYGGTLTTARRRATLLPGGHTLTAELGPTAPVAPPGAYLYDPDPAVVRAHLIDELARRLGAWKLDGQVAYLCADVHTDTPFARGFRVLSVQAFHLKRLRRFLQGEGMRPVEVRRRHFPMTPEAVRACLGRWEAPRPVTLVLTRLGDRPSCLVCDKVV